MPELLACPDCAGPLKNEGPVLRCSCAAWPVVGDIPLLVPWARNRTFSVEAVLARHRAPAGSLLDKLLRRVVSGEGPILRAISDRDATFLDLAAVLGRVADLDYFRYRFSDRSFITSAALLTPITRGPILDLGCGAGHLIRALSRRPARALVVGLDLNFSLLYLAKRFLAPGALLVCADASLRLPFLDHAFESAVSADAFKYITDRPKAASELLRVTRGPLVIAHFTSPSFRAAACRELFAARSPRVYRDEALFGSFLERRELDLTRPDATDEDTASLTAGVDPRVYPGADYFQTGSQINPIYEVREDGDRLQLRRRPLSENYASVSVGAEGYLPETLTIRREQVAASDPDLVRSFVLLDLPPNYC